MKVRDLPGWSNYGWPREKAAVHALGRRFAAAGFLTRLSAKPRAPAEWLKGELPTRRQTNWMDPTVLELDPESNHGGYYDGGGIDLVARKAGVLWVVEGKGPNRSKNPAQDGRNRLRQVVREACENAATTDWSVAGALGRIGFGIAIPAIRRFAKAVAESTEEELPESLVLFWVLEDAECLPQRPSEARRWAAEHSRDLPEYE